MRHYQTTAAVLAGLSLLLAGCRNGSTERKIRLSSGAVTEAAGEDLSTAIHLESAVRRSVAVMFFKNRTGDRSLDWLQRGLTEMFVRSLSQSQRLSVLSTDRLYELTDKLLADSTAADIDLDTAALFARKAQAEGFLTGDIALSGDSLVITAKLYNTESRSVIREEKTGGPGLESLFAMVDQLAGSVKQELTLAFADSGTQSRHHSLSDESPSVEAWQYYVKGVEDAHLFRYSRAAANLEKAVALDPDFTLAYIDLLRISIARGETKKTAQLMKILLSLKDRAPKREQFIIDIFDARLGRDPERAMEISRQWLQEYPNDVDPNLNLADIYRDLHKTGEAIKHYKRVLQIDPTRSVVYNLLGYTYAQHGNYQDAHAILDRYRALEPDEPNPYDSKAEIYFRTGELAEAERWYTKALAVDSSFSYSLNGLGRVYLEMGEYERALDIYLNRLLPQVTDPSNRAAAWKQAAILQWRLGRPGEAAESLLNLKQYTLNSYDLYLLQSEFDPELADKESFISFWQKVYDRIAERLAADPEAVNLLIRISLDYGLHVNRTASLLTGILNTAPGVLSETGKFLPAMLCMRAGIWDEYRPLLQPFFREYLDFLARTEELPVNYMGWSNFLVYNEYAVHHDPQEHIDAYLDAIRFCRQNSLVRSEHLFRSYLADLYHRLGRHDEAENELARTGIPPERFWLFSGPWNNRSGFNTPYAPEYSSLADSACQWRAAADSSREGFIDLRARFPRSSWSVGYGLIGIISSAPRQVQLRVGTNEAVKVFLNGKEVWKNCIFRDAVFDNDRINVRLRQGANTVLIKVCNLYGPWGYYFRVCDQEGQAVPGITFFTAE